MSVGSSIKRLPITGYEGIYEIGDDGEVYSIGRYHPCGPGGIGRKWVQSRKLKKTLTSNGRCGQGKARVSLYKEGVLKPSVVKRIVAREFLGNIDGCITHLDGDNMNCSLSNLVIYGKVD